MHSNIHHTINATELTARRDGHTLWYTHLRKLFALLFLMMASVGARATDYVFKYGNNYLGVNAEGTGIENLTTFDPARCIWTCVNGNNEATLGGTSYALRITYNGNTLYLNGSTTAGAVPTLSYTAQNVWRGDGTRIWYRNNRVSYYLYYRDNSWRTSSTGSSWQNTGYLSNNGNTDYRAALYTVQTTPHDATGTLSLSLSNIPTSFTWQENNHIFGVNAQPTVQNYIPAYTTYTFNGETHNWCAGIDLNNNTPATIYNADGFNYQWSVTVGGSNLTYVAQNSNMYYGNFDYNPMSQDDLPATVQLKLTHRTYPELTVSATANTTLNGAPSYNVTITPSTGGTITASSARAKQNSQVTLTATPDNGYAFGSWTVQRTDYNSNVQVTNNTFTMPGSDVTVSATFNAITYNVNVSNTITGGTVTASTATATVGTRVSLTATPATGYEFSSWDVRDASNARVPVDGNAFIMPASNVTVSAVFTLNNYTVTIADGISGGIVTASPTIASMGSQVTLSAIPENNFIFSQWNVRNASNNAVINVTNNTFTMPAADVVVSATFGFDNTQPYYFYNEEQGVFLSRGGQYAYQTMCDNIGMPYIITSKTQSTIVCYDMDDYGLYLPNGFLYTDGTNPVTWTFEGNDETGYTIKSNNSYIMASEAHQPAAMTTDASLASKWKIIGKQQYNVIREAKIVSNGTSVASKANISSIDEIYTYNYSPVDKTNSVTNANLTSIQGWTSTFNHTEAGDNWRSTNDGTEMYRRTGSVSQTISNLQPGVYKVTVQGFFRDGSAADDWSFAQAGYPISVMYLAANGEEARFPNRSEQGVSQDNPNSMDQFKTLVDQGRYLVELYTYVGSDGKLNLSINVPSHNKSHVQTWAIFRNLTLTYYENQMTGYTLVHSGSEITTMNGKYLLADDFVPGNNPIGTAQNPFTGTVDGQFNVIDGLTHPLFGTVNNATLKNIIVDNVDITRDGDVGAIACEAAGSTRIYNCGVLATNTIVLQKGHSNEIFNKTYTSSSTITCTLNNSSAGSIVGYLHDNARVINCYSYADVSAVTNAGGIVGWTGGWITQANQTTNGQGTFVMNCMFYGDIKAGTTRTPITYVQNWDNNNNARKTWTTYSYFRYKSIRTIAGLGQYNAMAAQEDMWLKRFKFYQSAVTNHRDLAAVYIFNDASRINEIAQWYIDEDIAPWPILRKAAPQKSILERTIPNTGRANEGNLITNGKMLVDEEGNTLDNDVTQRYNMNVGNGGYLTVNFSINGSSYSKRLPITDMDYEHYDYTWGKVVLPFANEFEGWTRNYDYICTGWEISSVTGGTTGTLTDYNFADRNCTAKDIYDATNNPIIFAQGGNWIVPYGVTSINVTAHFAKAYYLADANYDCSGNGGNAIGGTRPTTYHGRTVYTQLNNSTNQWGNITAYGAWAAMDDKVLPHDQALVLVGNFHYNSNQSGNYTAKACTIMSIDEDDDQQPDFGWYNSVGDYRASWMPMRWDFIALYGFNMVQTNTAPPGIAIPNTKGWMEFTETTICRTYEFESNDGNRSNNDDDHSRNAWIINGGYYQQMVRCYNGGAANKLSYMKVGGNAYIKEFFHGNHSGTTLKFTLRPIIVTGGEIEQCFMTGMGNKDEITATNNNVRFYCAGGKIDKYISAYNGYPVVDATMKVDHARIGRFFGGGTSPKAALSGNINITMNNSYVDFFCGGPEFGDMGNGKTVTVSTTGSIFGEYYGAGFGGTALTRITNGDGQKTPFAGTNKGGTRLNYNADAGGFEVSYEMEAILSGNGSSLWRYYDYRADLSMASTGNVTTTAKDCLFLNNFYGGGCQGKVNGTINSTLTNCDVVGSAFGGGYKAAATTIDVYPTGGNTWQVWDGTYKAYSDPIYPTPETFTWAHGSSNTADDNNNILYTTADMTQMGRVTNIINITINGGRVGQNVFGGGNESPSQKCTIVEVKNKCEVGGTVFGGGNSAPIGVSTKVTVDDSHVKGDVFGGGLGLPAVVTGNTTVWIKGIDCFIEKSVLGGGFGADVSGDTHVQIGGESLKTEYETTDCNNN